MGIDVGGGGESAVAQPDLYLFHRDAVAQQKAGTCVAKLVEAENEAILVEVENGT